MKLNQKIKTELKKRFGVWLARHSDVFDGHLWYVQNLMGDLLEDNTDQKETIEKKKNKQEKTVSKGLRYVVQSRYKTKGRKMRLMLEGSWPDLRPPNNQK